jgi:hypothetical protein
MSYGTRNYVAHGEPMFLAVGCDADGNVVRSAGPYATIGPAAGQRNRMLAHRRAVIAGVMTCQPAWTLVAGSEVRA